LLRQPGDPQYSKNNAALPRQRQGKESTTGLSAYFWNLGNFTRKGNLCQERNMGELRLGYYAAELGRRLSQRGLTLSVAESCTGGLICHQITNIPGSSGYFRGGIVAYSNRIKVQVLGVSEEVIQRWGAVSAPTVEQMARQAASLFETQWAVAVSGIAGPGGATPGKPVGLVWIAVSGTEGVTADEYRFEGTRGQIKHQAACAALQMLLTRLG
jgi:PncC family amidohydrolase